MLRCGVAGRWFLHPAARLPRSCRRPATAGAAPASLLVQQRRRRGHPAAEPAATIPRMTLEAFKEQLHKPDHVTVSGRLAKRMYMLTEMDLEELESVEQPNPYGEVSGNYELYWLSEVVALARARHGDKALIRNFETQYDPLAANKEAKRRIYGMIAGIDRWYTNPSSKSEEGMKSILQGLRSNVVIFAGKLFASSVTGSMALFADSMHSAADVLNYLYRWYSIRHSTRVPDSSHPYGYAPLRHICADRSFVGLLLVGGVVPVFAGAYELTELYHYGFFPPAPDPNLVLLSGAVLLLSMSMEGVAMRTAAAEMKEMGHRADIMTRATHLEAKAGVYGGLVGLVGVCATLVTGNPIVEIMCATVMGGIVSAVAVNLLGKSSTSLLGATLPVDRVTTVIETLQADDVVVDVFDVKTQVLGTDTVRFKAELHYNAEAITKRRRNLHEVTSAEARELFRELRELSSEGAAEDWLMRNDAEFLIAFSNEVSRLRGLVREELKEYRKVHVDLNVW